MLFRDAFTAFLYVSRISQLSFQNEGVKSTTTVKISRRPMSIRADSSHFTWSGRIFHDMVGPISSPRVGPTLLAQLMAIVMELVLSTPVTIMEK